jgi:DNA polymerase theta
MQGGHLVRIRGSFCQTATATGRLAMEDPNLQTVPKPRRFNVRATQTQVSAGGTTSHRREHEANIRCPL